MKDKQQPANTDAILAEYAAVRSEIQQLNGQGLSVLSGSLALNVAALGWLFGGKDIPSFAYALPTVGTLFLFFGNFLVLNRGRLAHRLALFQRYFLEPRLPDICWGRVYSEYRVRYLKKRKAKIGERLAESGSWVLFIASAVNAVILVFLGLSPDFTSSSVVVDWRQVVNLGVAMALTLGEGYLLCLMSNYTAVEDTMRCLARDCGLTPGCTRRPEET